MHLREHASRRWSSRSCLLATLRVAIARDEAVAAATLLLLKHDQQQQQQEEGVNKGAGLALRVLKCRITEGGAARAPGAWQGRGVLPWHLSPPLALFEGRRQAGPLGPWLAWFFWKCFGNALCFVLLWLCF